MKLNTLRSAEGSRPAARRVGRGIGSGLGKTCGRGHKGQSSRAGGFHKVGFEGGQMPLQRRLPKTGFTSLKSFKSAQVRLSEVSSMAQDEISLIELVAAGIIPVGSAQAKVFLSGTISRAVTLRGVSVSKGAREAIEAAGGKVE